MTSYEKLLIMVHNDPLAKADAIVLLEGDGFGRLRRAAELYKQGYAPTIVFSGEIRDCGYGSYPLSDCMPRLLALGVPRGAVVHERRSTQTAEQARYVTELAASEGWKRLILVASPHHQCRAYLTFLKQLSHGMILINAPARDLSWFKAEAWGARYDLLEQEQQRIERYTLQGDLATVEEAIEYQRWKEEQLAE